ncbi:site-specific integrase [Heyndrickxia camelliae]|uniref:Site-specific integrase n=1 Tax=Heyndrickxia camelliae TaxID=1707093 RepID=A0A2N3LKF3_9BACI|nr:site-specific integrase [Heyndrickxia camelliae]PKR85034.1 site-specific integrase [Heyndrickxia camelliae]
MNIVEPIRDKDIIDEIKEYLKKKNERNYILFMLGINTGLRIQDILKLRVRDVEGWWITIREKKTHKHKRIKMTTVLKKAVKEYIQGKPKNEYLIKSRNGKNRPITRGMAYNILNEVAREFGLESIGCHSMRKTYGYHFYKQFKDVAVLMDIFNHSSEKITLRYIGINQDTQDKYMRRFSL